MTDTLILFLPAQGLPWRWLRIADGAVGGRGEGFPVIAEGDEPRLVAIAPADAVTLHWAELPDRALAQSVAAARIPGGGSERDAARRVARRGRARRL